MPPGTKEVWSLYVVRTRGDRLYTGIATDVDRRLAEHGAGLGRGARSLRGRGPLHLVYRCEVGSRALALRVEYRLKRLPKPDKERLVEVTPPLEDLLDTLGLG